MNFTYENQGTRTYLVYELTENDQSDSMSLGMLTNNKIPGLATTIFTQLNATKLIKYDVSAKVSAKQFLSGPVNKKRLMGVFSGIVDGLITAEDYMIDTNTILLDLDYIFSDVSTCETVLICLPIIDFKNSNEEIGAFFKNIMFSTQFDQTENCDYVAKIINFLNSNPVFILEDFKKLLNEIANQTVSATPGTQPIQRTPVVKKQSVVQQPIANTTPVQKPAVQQSVVQSQNTPAPQVTAAPQVASAPVQVNTPSVPEKKTNSGTYVMPKTATNTGTVSSTDGNSEKKISLFGLLMHYNKENAELYKAQKAKKSSNGNQAQSTKQQPISSTSFAVPGQQTKVPTNASFAVPGQSTPVNMPNKPIVEEKKEIKTSTPISAPITSTSTPITVPQQVVPQGQSMNFGETTVLGGGMGAAGETTVLNAQPQQNQIVPHLIRSKNNERISLNKPVFRIGKERSYVDYFIADNAAVSRSHANIINRDGNFFVVDTNSTNHTFVNGAIIQSNTEVELKHGDKICLANEDFVFNLY